MIRPDDDPTAARHADVGLVGYGFAFAALFGVLQVGFWESSASASEAPPEVRFQRDIRPVLSNRCFKCHGPGTQKGDLRLDVRSAAEHVLKSEGADPAELIARITATDETRMPPAEAGDPLSPGEIAAIQAWVESGAEYTPHWAFVPPRIPVAPEVGPSQATWVRNGIDRFILRRLEDAGLSPSPEADRNTLLRRLSLDLIGLPPTPEETSAFVNDLSADAYEKVVDRLLASPHYGERHARHWLDLARYADSNGYTIDGPRSIWPYRDWVITAINADMPFDLFTIEQFAGDLLPGATREQIVATGFHRNTPFNEEGGTDPEQFRVERTVDRTNTTSSVWLGLTMACAQCHDHKYDPISQREYYQLYAFLNSIDEQELTMNSSATDSRIQEAASQLAAARVTPAPVDAVPTGDELVKLLRDRSQAGYLTLAARESRSSAGAILTRKDDLSILASGPNPDEETYTVEGWSRVGVASAIRIEAIPDETLPAQGPGRGEGGEFSLTSFTFEIGGKPVAFRTVVTDTTSPGFHPPDGTSATPALTWSESASTSIRTAVFILQQPTPFTDATDLRFTLAFKGGNLGRFRISLTKADGAFIHLTPAAQVLLSKPAAEFTDADKTHLSELLEPARSQIAVQERVRKLEQELKTARDAVPTTLVCRELSQPRPSYIQLRGDFLSRGDDVSPLFPSAISGDSSHAPGRADEPSRLALAKWLVRPDHPLTSRVYVNRVWQQLFGRGIVETENDFGMQGSLPTHPELLDWLATQFMSRGWSRKQLHRLIVTSATYRQASKFRSDLDAADPLNKLLGRQNRLRLEAEIVRDAALAASGQLTNKIGGPGVFPPQPPEVFSHTQVQRPWPESKGPDRYRRGLYTYLWRQCQHPLMTTFDGPDAQTACTRRNRSNTPLQALHLANDPAFVELAQALGERLVSDSTNRVEERLTRAVRLCLGRDPTAEELSRLTEFVRSREDVAADGVWSQVARVLFNLDEFITRE